MTMPTIINEKVHGIIDYAVVIFLLLSPTIFGFTGMVAIITYALAGIHFYSYRHHGFFDGDHQSIAPYYSWLRGSGRRRGDHAGALDFWVY